MRTRASATIFALLMTTMLCFATSQSFAETGAAAADGKKAGAAAGGSRKSTTINFEDQLVEGQAQKPELFYLLQKKNANFKRLIRLREDFLPEMKRTSEDIERKGSGN